MAPQAVGFDVPNTDAWKFGAVRTITPFNATAAQLLSSVIEIEEYVPSHNPPTTTWFIALAVNPFTVIGPDGLMKDTIYGLEPICKESKLSTNSPSHTVQSVGSLAVTLRTFGALGSVNVTGPIGAD